jgi:hypothetical protein
MDAPFRGHSKRYLLHAALDWPERQSYVCALILTKRGLLELLFYCTGNTAHEDFGDAIEPVLGGHRRTFLADAR